MPRARHGLLANAGCPIEDKDKDGIQTKRINVLDVFGVKENKGCPAEPKDTDKDGVNDNDDQCPTVAGSAKYKGLPCSRYGWWWSEWWRGSMSDRKRNYCKEMVVRNR